VAKVSAVHALTDMAKFKPKEPKEDFRVPVPQSLAKDLNQIARIRTAVNKAVGDGSKISVTEMLLEEAEELRDTQFKEWLGKPEDEAAEQKLIDKLVKVYRAEIDAAEKTGSGR
jgi:uncharacterized Zn finger protein